MFGSIHYILAVFKKYQDGKKKLKCLEVFSIYLLCSKSIKTEKQNLNVWRYSVYIICVQKVSKLKKTMK